MTRPTETPPGEGSTRIALDERDADTGPVSGNRTPATLALVAIGVLLVLVLAALVAGVVDLLHG